MTLPHPPPVHHFASDNAAAVHPAVLEALGQANSAHAMAYGNDRFTQRVSQDFDVLFGTDTAPFLVWGGTGGNVVALASLWRPGGAVLCTDCAHIHEDETAAPERMTGIKVVPFAHRHGKLLPEHILSQVHHLGDQHRPQACVVSITQATEYGTVYTAQEIRAICDTAHTYGIKVHLDGARIANAVASLGGTRDALRAFTVDAGVDVVTFGGTKNGMMYGEAVVFLDRELGHNAPFTRKQAAQLPSKMRYVAAQFSSIFEDDLWIATATHANAMATRLYEGIKHLAAVECDPPEANSLYPVLPRAAAELLQAWCPFYEWNRARSQYRWMTAWDTTADDVDRFVDGVRLALEG